MKKEYRIKKNKDFQEVFHHGASVANRQFVVYQLRDQDQAHYRIGLSVSKKLGNAVKRNQIKRYIRQAVQELQAGLHEKCDIVIIARKPASEMNFHEVKSSLIHVLKLARVLDMKKVDEI